MQDIFSTAKAIEESYNEIKKDMKRYEEIKK